MTDEREDIDILLEELAEPLHQSLVLVADEALNPQIPLMESALEVLAVEGKRSQCGSNARELGRLFWLWSLGGAWLKDA